MEFISEGADPFAGRKKKDPAIKLQGEVLKQETIKIGGEVNPLSPIVVEELKAWGSILNALKDGLPIPNNPIHTIEKIRRYEAETGEDLDVLKQCCSAQNEVREAQHIKPFFFAILDRIVKISKIEVKERR